MDDKELFEELKIIISDLKYEPFELYLNRNIPEVYDYKKDKLVVFLGIRSYEDKLGYASQCEDLCYIASKRIKMKYPELRIQIWDGKDNVYFKNKFSSHIFIIIKRGLFEKNILIDPSFKVVDYEHNFNYSKKRIIFDSLKHKGGELYIDAAIPYSSTTPIYFDSETKNLFFILFDEETKLFYINVNGKEWLNLNSIPKYTSNKRFLFFCKKLNEFKIKELDGDFNPRYVLINF